MKFLFISAENPLTHKKGGIAAYLKKISKLLISSGHQVTIISLDESYSQTIHKGIKYISVPNIFKHYKLSIFGVLINAWRIRREFRRIVNNESIDVVQIANFNWVGIFISNSNKYKKIVRISTSRILYDKYNNNSSLFKSKISELGEVYIMKHSDYVYAPSKLMACYYSETYNLNVDVIRPPLVNKSTINEGIISLPTRYFLFVGSVTNRKGAGILFEAFKKALHKTGDMKLVIAGEVNDSSIKKIIDNLPDHVRSNILFFGLVEKPELLSVIKKAHVAILPSLVDNLPNTAIECISMSTPIITIEKSSVDELVNETGFGVVIERKELKEMVDGISELMSATWHNDKPFSKNNYQNAKILDEMKAEKSISIFEEKLKNIN